MKMVSLRAPKDDSDTQPLSVAERPENESVALHLDHHHLTKMGLVASSVEHSRSRSDAAVWPRTLPARHIWPSSFQRFVAKTASANSRGRDMFSRKQLERYTLSTGN
jgi:hypothetical protein